MKRSPAAILHLQQSLATWFAAAVALASLPAQSLPLSWLAVGLLPAAILALLRQYRGSLLVHLGSCVAILAALAWSAHTIAGPIDRPAGLALTLLPPLGFVTMRGRPGELALGLFLSFCLLLVGTILGGRSLSHLLLFVAAAAVALRCEARLSTARRCQRTAVRLRSPVLLGHAGALALFCALCAGAAHQALRLLPSPEVRHGRPAATPAPADAPRSIGLSDSYDMAGGRASEQRPELLVTVSPTTKGQVVSDDLYLRTGFFQVADVDRWQVGPLEARELRARDELELAPATAAQELEVTCRVTGDLLFVPDGAVSLHGVGDLRADLARGWFRRTKSAPGSYRVRWQEPARQRPVDLRRNGLLALPSSLDRARLQGLLDGWPLQPEATAWQQCSRIADGLAHTSSYSLDSPSGQEGSALMNFLFGSRMGRCVHFASAAAVLLRLCSVPCRVAVGLHGGAPDRDGRQFSSQHAHAWVELPVADGWAVFDPTPPAGRGHLPQDRLFEAAPQGAAAEPEAADSLLRMRDVLLSPWLALALLLVLLGGPNLLPRRSRQRSAAVPREARPARALLNRILAELQARGRPRPAGQTLEQYGTALARAGAGPELEQAFAAYQEVRFGGRPLDGPREERLRRGLSAARALADAKA
jgi:hypothetical protein